MHWIALEGRKAIFAAEAGFKAAFSGQQTYALVGKTERGGERKRGLAQTFVQDRRRPNPLWCARLGRSSVCSTVGRKMAAEVNPLRCQTRNCRRIHQRGGRSSIRIPFGRSADEIGPDEDFRR